MANWTLELDDDGYQIVAPDGVESGVVDYGDFATLEYDGDLYMALVPAQGEEDEDFGLQVFCLEPQPTKVEAVEFEIEEAEAEEAG